MEIWRLNSKNPNFKILAILKMVVSNWLNLAKKNIDSWFIFGINVTQSHYCFIFLSMNLPIYCEVRLIWSFWQQVL
jgi:hypothetical protein